MESQAMGKQATYYTHVLQTLTIILIQEFMWLRRTNKACPSKTPTSSTTEKKNMAQKCPTTEEAVWECG